MLILTSQEVRSLLEDSLNLLRSQARRLHQNQKIGVIILNIILYFEAHIKMAALFRDWCA